LIQEQPLQAAILGREEQPCANGVLRAADLERLAFDTDLTGHGAANSEERLGQLGASGADQSGQPNNLAAADLKINRSPLFGRDTQTGDL
jgi:hypothetical protein